MDGISMLDKTILAYLRLVHGTFNVIVFALIVYQGSLGYRIRKSRLAGMPAGNIIRRHRKNGPVFVVLGIAGFFSGAVLLYIDSRQLLKYPLHLLNGAMISSALIGMFLISKKIRAGETRWRTVHFRLGIATIFLYIGQLFLGLDIIL